MSSNEPEAPDGRGVRSFFQVSYPEDPYQIIELESTATVCTTHTFTSKSCQVCNPYDGAILVILEDSLRMFATLLRRGSPYSV